MLGFARPESLLQYDHLHSDPARLTRNFFMMTNNLRLKPVMWERNTWEAAEVSEHISHEDLSKREKCLRNEFGLAEVCDLVKRLMFASKLPLSSCFGTRNGRRKSYSKDRFIVGPVGSIRKNRN